MNAWISVAKIFKVIRKTKTFNPLTQKLVAFAISPLPPSIQSTYAKGEYKKAPNNTKKLDVHFKAESLKEISDRKVV